MEKVFHPIFLADSCATLGRLARFLHVNVSVPVPRLSLVTDGYCLLYLLQDCFVEETRGMRIAQLSPLVETVPPRLYGGMERVVSCLTEELVKRGHEATLFDSGDSVTSAKLVSVCQRSPSCGSVSATALPRLIRYSLRCRLGSHQQRQYLLRGRRDSLTRPSLERELTAPSSSWV